MVQVVSTHHLSLDIYKYLYTTRSLNLLNNATLCCESMYKLAVAGARSEGKVFFLVIFV